MWEPEKSHVTFGFDYLLSTERCYTLLVKAEFTVCAVAGDRCLHEEQQLSNVDWSPSLRWLPLHLSDRP